MHDLQLELDGITTNVPIDIIGVNQVGYEEGNDTFTAGRDVPWLQEQQEDGVWATWGVTYRDVVILDGESKLVAVYNLTDQSLGDTPNYDALKKLLVDAANAE